MLGLTPLIIYTHWIVPVQQWFQYNLALWSSTSNTQNSNQIPTLSCWIKQTSRTSSCQFMAILEPRPGPSSFIVRLVWSLESITYVECIQRANMTAHQFRLSNGSTGSTWWDAVVGTALRQMQTLRTSERGPVYVDLRNRYARTQKHTHTNTGKYTPTHTQLPLYKYISLVEQTINSSTRAYSHTELVYKYWYSNSIRLIIERSSKPYVCTLNMPSLPSVMCTFGPATAMSNRTE